MENDNRGRLVKANQDEEKEEDKESEESGKGIEGKNDDKEIKKAPEARN